MPDFVSNPMTLALVAALAYLLGSVPFGVVTARVMGLGNLRDIGSGNIGATNVLRTGNKLAAFITLILDAGKGAVAVLIARQMIGEDAAQIAALAAFLGHLYPIWLGFKGGKGVATFLGILWALFWPLGALACIVWLMAALGTRFSSYGALMASVFAPVIAYIVGYPSAITLIAVLSLLVIYRHLGNIRRLRDGTEPKIGKKT